MDYMISRLWNRANGDTEKFARLLYFDGYMGDGKAVAEACKEGDFKTAAFLAHKDGWFE